MSSSAVRLAESYSSATRTYSSCLCSASPNYSLFLFPHLLVRVVELDADVLPELVAVAEEDDSEVAATEEPASETSAKMAMSSAGTLELQVGHETCAVLTILKLDVDPQPRPFHAKVQLMLLLAVLRAPSPSSTCLAPHTI